MASKKFVVFNNENHLIIKIVKENNKWYFYTDNNKFTIYDDIKFVYECSECGKLSDVISNHKILFNDNKLCKYCVKKGERNPFYGKTHSNEMIEKTKKKLSKISKKLWKNEEYRNKVTLAVAKPRVNSFKKEQSVRVKQWYVDNPSQKNIRSKHMKNTWKTGNITPNVTKINRSKGEKILLEYLKKELVNYDVREKATIKIGDKWIFPDIIINDKIIVEYFGDYWHGNPKKYKCYDLVAHKVIASIVWERDNERIKLLEDSGYKVIIVWSSDNYKDNGLLENIKLIS